MSPEAGFWALGIEGGGGGIGAGGGGLEAEVQAQCVAGPNLGR